METKQQVKHTNGPWYLGSGKEDKHNIVTTNGNMIVFLDGRRPVMNENKANARLIAAAPELLEACKEALDVMITAGICLEGYELWGKEKYDNKIALIGQAIAKAEGRG